MSIARYGPKGPQRQHSSKPAIPEPLVRAILDGNCIAFVGAGFSAAAGLPRWGALLQGIAAKARLTVKERDRLEALVERGGGHALDQAAQLLQERLKRRDLLGILVQMLAKPPRTPDMARRLHYLQRIPFRAILTTNFDGSLTGLSPGSSAYRRVLHPETHRWWERTFWDDKESWPVVVKLHGMLPPISRDEVVLTRRDYRRLLYENPSYITFLRSALSTTTVLYLGFSFEDAYLNELRSEVLAMLGQDKDSPPTAYAVANDVPLVTQELFKKHEGVEFLSYEARGADFSGFDRYLEELYRKTNPLPRFAAYLGGKRILWVDRHASNNEEGRAFLRRAAREAIGPPSLMEVRSPQKGLEELRKAKAKREQFDLVLTHWGAARPGGRTTPAAVELLAGMRKEDLRAPVIVFASANDAEKRRRKSMGLGAVGYYFRWESLFQEMERVLAPIRS